MRLTRREFGALALALPAAPRARVPAQGARRGLLRISRGGIDLDAPRDAPAGETWHYQITLPFQVAPRLAAVLCNIRKGYAGGVDFENPWRFEA